MRVTNKILLIGLLLMFPNLVSAQSDSGSVAQSRQWFWEHPPKPSGWVNDYEDLFSDREERTLDSLIRLFKSKTSIEIAIVSLDTLMSSREQFDALSLHLANTWGLGEKGKNNGVLIALSRGHRKMRIQNGYGIEKMISDQETKEIIDSWFIPSFREGEYYEGTYLGLVKLMEILSSNK